MNLNLLLTDELPEQYIQFERNFTRLSNKSLWSATENPPVMEFTDSWEKETDSQSLLWVSIISEPKCTSDQWFSQLSIRLCSKFVTILYILFRLFTCWFRDYWSLILEEVYRTSAQLCAIHCTLLYLYCKRESDVKVKKEYKSLSVVSFPKIPVLEKRNYL